MSDGVVASTVLILAALVTAAVTVVWALRLRRGAPAAGPRPPAPADDLPPAPRPALGTAPPRRLDDLLSEVDVLVRVLGTVEIVRLVHDGGGAPVVEEKLVPSRMKALEAVAYLALRESPVDRETLEIRLFPDGTAVPKTVYNTISAARNLLGENLFPPPGGGRYELSEAVETDYGVFGKLLLQADRASSPAASATLLTEALGLVAGEPFVGVGRNYAWAGPHRGRIVSQVVGVAERLTESQLGRGDLRTARWAARQGLRAFPADERLYRLLMRTAAAAGDLESVRDLYAELQTVIAHPDGVGPATTASPETVALVEELTAGALPVGGRAS